ncbi:MAG: response regulator transcription factor [Fibrobacterales bacterium]
MKKILIIEDDEDIRELLSYNLTQEGYTVIDAPDGQKGLEMFWNDTPHLVLLDIMMPGKNGIDVLKEIRNGKIAPQTPVILVSAKGEELDIVMGLELGADDYMVKPFSLKVLFARIRKVFSKAVQKSEMVTNTISHYDITIDDSKRKVSYGENDLDLTASEFSALYFLISKPGRVYTRNQIISAVHGDDYFVTDRSIDVLIVSLRKKMGYAGKLIETIRGVGYKFAE